MEKLLQAIENRKKATQRALDQLNEILQEIKKAYGEKNIKIGNLILQKVINCPRGNWYYADIFIDDSSGYPEEFELVSDVEDLNKGSYAYGDYNCWRNHLKRKQLLYILKNLRNWIETKTKEEEKFTNELNEILTKFFK